MAGLRTPTFRLAVAYVARYGPPMQVPVSIVESEAISDVARELDRGFPEVLVTYLSILRSLDAGRPVMFPPGDIEAFERAGLLSTRGNLIASPTHDAHQAALEEKRRKNRLRQARWRANRRAKAGA